ncbi:MAG: zinc ribbon domain-containing protein [Desulfobacter sp.]|nr:zinc ribbon domain-containing protein [Desulfobacter sp.]WDP85912.1 MAG: zinc ribbon domain-containing protein [Desulfobacter sp.]
MPVYEYQCQECGRIEEAFQRISAPPLEVCPHCSGRLKKLISQSSFHLKGTGWYVTDYGGAKSGTPKGSEAKGKSTSKSEKSTSKSSDSK